MPIISAVYFSKFRLCPHCSTFVYFSCYFSILVSVKLTKKHCEKFNSKTEKCAKCVADISR